MHDSFDLFNVMYQPFDILRIVYFTCGYMVRIDVYLRYMLYVPQVHTAYVYVPDVVKYSSERVTTSFDTKTSLKNNIPVHQLQRSIDGVVVCIPPTIELLRRDFIIIMKEANIRSKL